MHPALQYCVIELLSLLFDLVEADELPRDWESVFNGYVTSLAENQRFSPQGYHPFYPFRFCSSWVFMKFAHGIDMMDFYVFVASAQFAEICQKPLHKFCSMVDRDSWRSVIKCCFTIPLQGYSAPCCYKRLFTLIGFWLGNLESFLLFVSNQKHCPIFLIDFGY